MKASQVRYAEYLQTEHWRKIRRKAVIRDKHKCLACGSPKMLQAHHIRYPKEWLSPKHTEKLLLTLCDSCHVHAHTAIDGGMVKKGRGSLASQTLKAIQKLRNKTTEVHIAPIQKPSFIPKSEGWREGNFLRRDGRLIYSPRI